jgi:hypothetical protein
MPQILAVALLSAAFGLLLASGEVDWHFRASWVGVAAMLASAWAARRYWQSLRPENGPGSPERELWHGLASYSLIAGFLGLTLWRMGPALELHSLAGHRMGIDSWTLVIGTLVSYAIARDPEPRKDERDALIATRGQRTGYYSLLLMLVIAIPLLGFGEHTVIARLNQAMLAHLLILMLTVHYLIQQAAQLYWYAIDARAEREST